MRETRIDFLARPTGSSHIGIILLVIGALCAGGVVWDDSTRGGELTQMQTRLKKVKSAWRLAELAQSGGADKGLNLAGINQSEVVARRLATPWGALLDALERAQTEDIALLGIEPNAGRARLRLSGEAKDMDALVSYIRQLDGRGGITELRLLAQQIKLADAQHPVEFVLESEWLKSDEPTIVAGSTAERNL